MISTWDALSHEYGRTANDAHALRLLAGGVAAVVVLKNALSPQACARVAASVDRLRGTATVSRYTNGSLTTFGTYLAKHLDEPERYFAAVKSNDVLFDNEPYDVRAVVRERMRRFLLLRALDVAAEPDGSPYAPAIVRVHGDGVSNPLHNDNIMRDAAGTGLVLAGLRHQFSCVTCVQECDAGGELLLYRRRWTQSDEAFKVRGGLGYEDVAVEGAELLRFRPATGDVYLMDPTNFHAIETVHGRDRLTLGFFFGFYDDALLEGVCWS